MASIRVTITLPPDVVSDIDRRTRNRSRFVLDAVQREVERRRREELRRSIAHPHPEASTLADAELEDWGKRSDDDDLYDAREGTAVRWVPGKGWMESKSEPKR